MKTNLEPSEKGQVGIYIVHNPNTDETYVGSGILGIRQKAHEKFLRSGKHWNHRLQKAYNKDPSFEFIGISLGENAAGVRLEALAAEQAIIDEYWGSPLFMNLARDAETMSGFKHRADTIESLREITSKRWQDPQWREKTLAAQNAGRASMSPEAREVAARNRATALKEAYETGQRGSIKGQTRSDAFKAHNSQMISEKWSEPEYRAKQMAARTKGVYRDTEMAKPVEIEGVAYSTVSAAARAHGMTKQGVGYRLKTRTFPNWNYVEKK